MLGKTSKRDYTIRIDHDAQLLLHTAEDTRRIPHAHETLGRVLLEYPRHGFRCGRTSSPGTGFEFCQCLAANSTVTRAHTIPSIMRFTDILSFCLSIPGLDGLVYYNII
jgi:hypothetical protein